MLRRGKPASPGAPPRQPVAEGFLRCAAVPVLWAAVTLSRPPHWAIAGQAAFHAAAGVALAWSLFVLGAALRRPRWSGRLSRAALTLDMAAIGALAFATGGWASPFLALVLLALLALVLLGDPRRALGAALAAVATLGVGASLALAGRLPIPPPFATGGPALALFRNPVYLATVAVLGGATLLVAAAAVVLLTGRAARAERGLAFALAEAEAANRALDESFRRIEELSTASTRLADRIRASEHTGTEADAPAYKH